jgi:hypothetical protein
MPVLNMRLTIFMLLLSACTPFKQQDSCALPEKSVPERRLLLIPSSCERNSATESDFSISACPRIELGADDQAVVQLVLYPDGVTAAHKATYHNPAPGTIEIKFPYSTPNYNLCFGGCFHVESDLSDGAYRNCEIQCNRRLLSDYGKVTATFPVKMVLRVGSEEAQITSIEGTDPDPVPGKRKYEFKNPFEGPLTCRGVVETE